MELAEGEAGRAQSKLTLGFRLAPADLSRRPGVQLLAARRTGWPAR